MCGTGSLMWAEPMHDVENRANHRYQRETANLTESTLKLSKVTAVPRYISRRSASMTAPETKTLQEVFDETSKTPRCAQKSGE
jgi:hypothetical protein